MHRRPPWPPRTADDASLAPLARHGRVQLVTGGDTTAGRAAPALECYAATPLAGAMGHATLRHWPADLAAAAEELRLAALAAVPAQAPRTLLVCAHGSRDRCCGSLGTRLVAGAAHGRVLRTSHLGGHRFAPTVMSLPDGRYWAHADQALLRTLAVRDRPPAAIAPRLRGTGLLADPGGQLLDAVALCEVGWAWEGWSRRVGSGSAPDGLELEGWRAGSRIVVTGTARVDRVLEVPPCGGRGDPVIHAERGVRSVRVRRWDAGGSLTTDHQLPYV